jgi:hypothetical protein
MNQSGSFYRKIAYLLVIVILLFPIAWLARPSAVDDVGGKLAQLRDANNLGQSDLGQIDPASETIRLATLGLRGIAVSLLWSKANHYKKVEDWTAFRATLEQLAKLQPYFIAVWRYQAWNLTYNVSVELDAVKDRYYYVRRGIQYLDDGIRYNVDNPTLLSDLGWFIGNKIGRADEREQYRRLFKTDEDYHNVHNPNLTPEQRDNWLVSRRWYEEAVRSVDEKKQSLGNKNPTTFYASPAMSQINYSDAIEDEGTFGARARAAWNVASEMWKDYGNRELRSSRGFLIKLSDLERVTAEIDEIRQELDAFDPALLDKMREENLASLTPQQRAAWDGLPAEASEEEMTAYGEAQAIMDITPEEVATRLAKEYPDKASGIRRLTTRLVDLSGRLAMINSNRDVSNFAYWQTRCEFEQTDEALAAREAAWAADRKFKDQGDPFEARALYEEAFYLWGRVYEAFPELADDSTTGGDIVDVAKQYADALEQLDLSLMDKEVADNFPLWEVLESYDSDRRFAEAIEKWRGSGASTDAPTTPSLINPADAFSEGTSPSLEAPAETPAESSEESSEGASTESSEGDPAEPPADPPAEASSPEVGSADGSAAPQDEASAPSNEASAGAPA